MRRRVPTLACCVVAVWLSLSVCLPSEARRAGRDPEKLLELKVRGVTLDPHSEAPIVVLEDVQGHRAFPIWIGMNEAQAIALTLQGAHTPRPLTHALLRNILATLRVDVERVVINDLRDNTFYALIFLRRGQERHTIDARPSDAIALALGVQAPLYVTDKVLQAVRTVTLPAVPPKPSVTKQLGLHVQELDARLARLFDLPSPEGVLVSFVEEGSPAERSGVQRGDVITAVDATRIKSIADLLAALHTKTGGETVVLHLQRHRQARQVRLVLPAGQ